MSDSRTPALPFQIRARWTGGDLVTFFAQRDGADLTTERYHVGNGNRRREVAQLWANDPRLCNGCAVEAVAVEHALEGAEIRAVAAMDAQREAAIAAAEAEPLDDGDDDGEEKRGPSTSELLVRLALEHYRIGVDDRDEPFAVRKDGPNVALMFRGARDALRASLSRLFRQTHERTPNAAALGDALMNLQGEALEATPERTYLRVAKHCDGIIIDLGTAAGRAVMVTPQGWRVVDKSPVLFRRTALTSALPAPESGGDLRSLARLLNLTDESWPLVLGWLIAAFLPDIPHPILMFGGEAGSGKSTAARMVLGLFDPTSAPLRSQPADVEQWALAANGSWGVGIDNVSAISQWWSDSLCKAVTGDGWVRRKLYTDGELSVVAFRRVVMLTSIDAGALRGDLGDRVLLCDLERIPDDKRRGETELDAIYEQHRPLIFGAILDLLSQVLRMLPSIRMNAGPRMFDFARVLAAIDKVRGTDALATYAGQRERIAADVIEADPVAKAIIGLVERHGDWSGTMTGLLTAITPNPTPRFWPGTPRALAGRIKRTAPALRATGIEVERGERDSGRKRERMVTVRKTREPTVRTVQIVRDPAGDPEKVDSGRTVTDGTDGCGLLGGSDRPTENLAGAAETRLSDGSDDLDGWIGDVSGDDSDQRDGKAIAAMAIPDGWTRKSWADRLDQLADRCGAIHADTAAEYRRQARAIRGDGSGTR